MATNVLTQIQLPLDRPRSLGRSVERRTFLVYAGLCVLGLLPLLRDMPASWQAAGLGLWLPGGGFLTLGLIGIIPLLITVLLFVAAMIAWFGAGMAVAPVIVWGGAAVLAALVAPETSWNGAPYAVVALTVATVVTLRMRYARKQAADIKALHARNAFLPGAIQSLRERSLPEVPASARELSLEQLQLQRYALDRALQPIANFDGFDQLDQFQTAAIRYQINVLGYALALSQCHYTPNFHGYVSQAQRNLIDKYLQRRVWSYWIYETIWGHLNFTNFDPVGRDNVMLTGFFGIQVGLYMSNTGDMRYMEEGSLPFRLNDRTCYAHRFEDLIGSIHQNFDQSDFCLYPCEPNWIYPICNHYGMTAATLGDRLMGTSSVPRLLPRWLQMLDDELTDRKGSPISLKSSLTGWMPPFPAADGTYVPFANCFIPERAERLWAFASTEMSPLVATGPDGKEHLALPGAGIDFGNYRKGHAMSYAFIKMAAREMGDARFAALASDALAAVGGLETVDGVAHYTKASNIGNGYAIMAAMQQRNDLRNAVCHGPAAETRHGPILAEASYPDVLVGRAYSRGDDLELVLQPGGAASLQVLGIERLQPNGRYVVKGLDDAVVTADAQGRLRLEVDLRGRTPLHIMPAPQA